MDYPTLHTFQIKEYILLNGIKEFLWSISFYGNDTRLRLNSGKVHTLTDVDVWSFID